MNRGAGLRIGRILGIPIYLHSTWCSFLPHHLHHRLAFNKEHPLWTDTQHWTVGVLTSFSSSPRFSSRTRPQRGSPALQDRVFPSPSSFRRPGAHRARTSRRFRNSTSRSPGRWPADCSGGFLGLTLLFPLAKRSEHWPPGSAGQCRLAVFNLLPDFLWTEEEFFRAIVWE